MPSLIECPFCGKKTILTNYNPSVLQIRGSRGSGQSGKMTFRTRSDYIIINGCKECGKNQKEVSDKFEGKLSEQDILERCIWCGNPRLPGKLECEECATK